jgi:phosphotransferase system enzyme I (PtsI)
VAECTVEVISRLGLHARAAANLVRLASRFKSKLTLQRPDGSAEADAKSILSILTLAASYGTKLKLTATGEDAQEALDAICGLFARAFDENEFAATPPAARVIQELRRSGLGVSDGVVVGRVLRLQKGARDVYRAEISDGDLERERRRFRAAVRLSRRQLDAIKQRAEKELGRGHAYIFDAHLLFLEDAKLTRDVEDYIGRERSNAEWATKVVGDRLLSIYAQMNDEYLRERGSDIEDVIQRLLANLTGEGLKYPNLSEDAVIVAPDLLPSTVAELDLSHVKAIATDSGGWTSHMAIIARGLGLTAVVGLRDFYQRTRTGDRIIVDARQGEVILHPTPETEQQYVFSLPALRANVELPMEFQAVRKFGACGVGLFRSEFLLSRPGLMNSEQDQYDAYKTLAEAAGIDGAVVRLFDVGGEIGNDAGERERNPALGLRAVRFGLKNKDVMRTQVRAILRAATAGRLSLVIPMVADLADVLAAKKLIKDAIDSLKTRGEAFAEVPIGAMIEVPSAVLTAEKIAGELDFFELGTNDLVQYTLAVDRGNDQVAGWFRTLHPAVLYGIKRTLEAGADAGIPVIVCGEMASTPAYAVLLAGLGATDLSMTPAMIPRVRAVLAQIETREAREIADKSLAAASADEVEEIVRNEYRTRWPELFQPNMLPRHSDN